MLDAEIGGHGHQARVHHAVRHDPARVLRQVAFERWLLEEHDGVHRCDWGEHRGGEHFEPCSIVLKLAEAYGIEP